MTTTAVLCSGQGEQGPDMFDLLADAPEAAPVFAAATRVLGHDPREWVREAGAEDLYADRAAQILCCTQALAAWAVLGPAVPRPIVVAGYSVGEVAAWGVAGVLGVPGVLDLAAARAEAMDRATGARRAGLLAVSGLSRATVERICAAHDAHLAIVNGPDAVLVGGLEAALDAVGADAGARGARTVRRVRVAVPSHTPLLADAATAFGRELRARVADVIIPAGVRLLSGVDGGTVFTTDGLDKLAAQVARTVDWAACLDACRAAGATRALELGPGTALARMVRRTEPGIEVHGVAEFRSVAGVRRWVGRER
jgi:[acyl-carrier-protein] S-malonyltransferase